MSATSQSLIFAHRGANHEAAENTRSAFDKALQYAIDGIETDIQLSRDEVAVLWHDRFLGKAGFPGKRIDDFDYAQLQAMNFAAHFSPDARPEGIMSLQEFVHAYRKRCRLLLEIKIRESEPLSRREIKVRKTLETNIGLNTGTENDVSAWASSFDLATLVYAHECAPNFPLIYNFESNQTIKDAQQILAAQPFLRGLCLPIATLDAAIVGLLRQHRKCIAVYTCNSDAEINKALDLGIDILISDVPQKALHMRDEFNAAH